MKKLSKLLWIALGLVAFAVGTIGIVVPLIPTTSPYMLAVFCFAKSSERLHKWFLGTGLYKKYLAEFIEEGTMTKPRKWKAVITITIVFAIGFFFARRVPIAQIIIVIIWFLHICFILFKIKTRE